MQPNLTTQARWRVLCARGYLALSVAIKRTGGLPLRREMAFQAGRA